MTGRTLLPALALLILAAGAPGADAHAGQAHALRATLANGLRVVIVRNTLAPVVATSLNYLVGADETPPGFPGMAHALEHMMFRGSPGLTAEQLADIGSLMGGRFNADTGQTVTQYFYTVPATDLGVVLHIEALRMRSVLDSETDWKHERGAIEQEVAQDLSSPQYVLFTKLRGALFQGTSYAHDALGTRASFDATTAAMLRTFHDRWYAPNNAILVIAGDIDPPSVLAQVRQLFGPIPPRALPARAALRLTPVIPRALALASDLPYGLQVIALRMPGLDSADYAAAEVLADVLGSRRGALHDLAVQGKALYTEFSFDPLRKAGLAYALAAFPAGGKARPLESEMRAVLERIATRGVSPDLVAAAKLQERRAAESEKDSIDGLAMAWSEALAVEGIASPDDDLARIERVTVDDVNRVARKVLDLGHTVTAVLTPRSSGGPVALHGFGGKEHFASDNAAPAPLPPWAAAAQRPPAVPALAVHPSLDVLPNGITLIVQPENVSETVSVYGRVRNRPQLQVPEGKEGLSGILEQLFPYGSKRRGRVALQRALDAIGAEEEAGTDFSLQTLAEHFDRGVELLADNLLHPAFPERAFRIVRRRVAQTAAGELTSPDHLSRRALRAALFPKNDPMLREPLPATVGAVRLKDVRDYYRAAFRPDLTTIVVIGKVTPRQARETIEKYFASWTATGPAPATELPPVPLSGPGVDAVPDASRVQDRVMLAETLGLTRFDRDYYALELGNHVLGGGFYATRLSRDLRKDAGLVYDIRSDFEFDRTRGLYAVEYACDPRNVAKVHERIAAEIRRMQETPATPAELERAKALQLRRATLREADVEEIASGILERSTLGLPLDEPAIAARRTLELGAPEVQAAFRKWLRPDDLVRVSQGPVPR